MAAIWIFGVLAWLGQATPTYTDDQQRVNAAMEALFAINPLRHRILYNNDEAEDRGLYMPQTDTISLNYGDARRFPKTAAVSAENPLIARMVYAHEACHSAFAQADREKRWFRLRDRVPESCLDPFAAEGSRGEELVCQALAVYYSHREWGYPTEEIERLALELVADETDPAEIRRAVPHFRMSTQMGNALIAKGRFDLEDVLALHQQFCGPYLEAEAAAEKGSEEQ